MIRGFCRRPLIAFAGVAVMFLIALPAPASGQQSSAETLLNRADDLLARKEYKPARSAYLEAEAVAQSALEMSRATFGVGFCYFQEGNKDGATVWLERLAKIDPNKKISAHFYPQAFVDLFDEIVTKGAGRETSPLAGATGRPTAKQAGTPPPADAERPAVLAPIPRVETALPDRSRGGHWEINVHYGSWSVDPILSAFEDDLIKELSQEFQNAIVDEIGAKYAGLVQAVFTPEFSMTSEGSTYGVELRYYLRGRNGTFSFGLGVEKTRIKLGLGGTVRQMFLIGSVAQASAEAAVDTAPLFPHASFRWEIGRPSAKVKPFITFGLGVAPLDGTFTYSYEGTYQFGLAADTIGDAQTKTFAELSKDIDFDIPDFLPVIQLNVGLKIELFGGLIVLGDVGLWDGLLLRGGLGFRF